MTTTLTETVTLLSPNEHAFFADNGYLVIPNAVPRAGCDAVVETIWDFLDMDPDRPDDWYRPPHVASGMVELYQHQSLWDCRQSPRVHQAFAELWGMEKLWVSLDRVNRKPPVRADDSDGTLKRGFGYCHWDFDTNDLPQTPPAIQGVLCLTDTPVGMGGFQCVPGFHKPGLLEDWIAAQPSGRTGDLIVWSNRLAHGNGHNTSSKCRFAQYIALHPAPAGDDAEAVRAGRIRQWREQLPPNEPWAPGDPTGWERAHQSHPAELTPLGRKLLGLDPW
jgi:hypothetical protein